MHILLRALLWVALATVRTSAATAGSADDGRHVKLPSLKSCQRLSNITAAEFHGLKNLNQLIQSKGRRANELRSFISYKEAPTNDTAMRAMWNSSRWGLQHDLLASN
jgi:hypothetical protein